MSSRLERLLKRRPRQTKKQQNMLDWKSKKQRFAI